jgi:hypothetical protein
VEFTVEEDPEESRALTAMLVEPSGDEKLDFRLRGRLVVLTAPRSALAELASTLSDLAADPTEYRPGMRQLRLVGFDERLRRDSCSIVFDLR